MSKTENKPKFSFGSRDKCTKCGQTVYLVEKVTVEGKTTRIFHNYCLRCTTCDRVVTLGNYIALDDQIYCKPHYLAEVHSRKNKGPIEVVNKKPQQQEEESNEKEAKPLTDSDEENHKQEEEVVEEEVVEEEVVEE